MLITNSQFLSHYDVILRWYHAFKTLRKGKLVGDSSYLENEIWQRDNTDVIIRRIVFYL